MMIRTSRISEAFQARRELRRLCDEAVSQQIESGQVVPTHLRNRRRHLARQVLKKVPVQTRRSPKKLFHAAAMVLAMWGFGVAMPAVAEAVPDFRHVMLNDFDVGYFAAPTFADIDGDGDLDAFVGESSGTVKYYRNDGAAGFVADAAGNPLAGIDVGSFAKPAFADIDGDGDLDAFVGESRGTVKYYRNDGAAGFVPDTAGNPLNGIDVGDRAVPTFADIDGDGDLDAFVGEHTGTVKYYRNDGAAGFVPDTAGNPLAGIDVGYQAAPTFADIDGDGDLDAFVGEGYGTVKYFRNDGAAGFVPDTAGNPLNGFDVGNLAAPTFADSDGDGDLDAFVGGNSGTVKYYRNDGAAGFVPDTAGNPLNGFDVGNRAAPTFADIDGDGDLDAFVGENAGTVKYYRNDGAAGFAPDTAGNPLAGFDVGYFVVPTFADIDGDGDLDAFVGEYYGTVKYYRNDGAAGFVPDTAGNPLNGFDVGNRAAPTFADIDGDGDLDAFVGERFGTVKYYRNDGAAGFVADPAGNPLAGIDVGFDAAPTFADIDGDGDLDAFVGEGYGTVKYYRNDGAAGFVADAAGNPLAGIDVGYYTKPAFADIDGDGDLDAFVGEGDGTVRFFENIGPAAGAVARNDFNGDGKSDILWRNTATGLNYLYMMDGTAIVSQGSIDVVPGPDWQIVGTGDYDGNNTADILWRNSVTGENRIYFMDGNTILSQGTILTVSDTDWQVAGSGNYDGIGGDDILWRHAVSGQNHIWFMNGLTIASQGTVNFVPAHWQVMGSGDLDADGKSDILWRNSLNGRNHAYLMDGATIASQGTINTVPLNWNVAGTGDYDGDGKSDILWRNTTNGRVHMYFLDGFTLASQGTVGTVPLEWAIAGDGDYDGNGKADILWRNMTPGDGRNYIYFMDGNVIASSGSVNAVSNFDFVIVDAP